jgi:two-component system cell cycle sensor histidine kinase/response regulator CckA
LVGVGRLAGGVANDFNNLLTVINGRSQLLQKALAADDHLRRHADLIEKTASRASRLTQQLLAFSRQQVLQPTVLDLNAVLTDMAPMLRRLAADIAVEIVPAPDLGHVKADRGQIEQVDLNVAVNARDAMPAGGRLIVETANITVDAAVTSRYPGLTPGAYVILAVSDTGCGMTPEVQARIFEPFFTTKGPEKGMGLGLSTVYGVVKQSGGDILVYSEVGRGTTLRIFLPRVEEPLEPIVEGADARASGGAETILLVEDENGVRELAHEVLAECGYTVIDAANPGEALLIGERHEGCIDLLVTDLMMPQMSGRELADRLAPLRPDMKVLYMSGYADAAVVHQAGLEPTMAFLAKPFATAALTAKVRELLAGKA